MERLAPPAKETDPRCRRPDWKEAGRLAAGPRPSQCRSGELTRFRRSGEWCESDVECINTTRLSSDTDLSGADSQSRLRVADYTSESS